MKRQLVTLLSILTLYTPFSLLADDRSQYDSETYGQMTRSLRLGWEFNDAIWVRDFEEAKNIVEEQKRIRLEDADKNEALLSKMQELFERGEESKLADLKDSPNDITKHFDLALYYFDWFKLNASEEALNAALKINPKDLLCLELQTAITKAKGLTTPKALSEFVFENFTTLDKLLSEAQLGPVRPVQRGIASLPEISQIASLK